MPKSTTTDEVQVLRFFETEPLEKAAAVFNIVRARMKDRLGGQRASGADSPAKDSGAHRKRSAPQQAAQTPSFDISENTERTES
jgi:hypothetical protein